MKPLFVLTENVRQDPFARKMSRFESTMVGLVIGIACPLLTFVAFWWTAAALHLCVFRLPPGLIIMAALAGLSLGCLLDVVFLRLWVTQFYAANVWLLVPVYLGLCVVAVGFCMGIPVGAFSLGVVAGIYSGRRERHRQADEAQAAIALRRVAVFAASVTAAAALPIGILALQSEQDILRSLEATFGLNRNGLQGGGGYVLIAFLCALLFALQYGCSRIAGCLAFRIGPGDAGPKEL
jgi:small-conductance mechanosensitive channel